MYVPDETIVAIATPPGRGGVAVVRLSGAEARRIAEALIVEKTRLEPRRATLVTVETGRRRGGSTSGLGTGVEGGGALAAVGPRDQAVVTWFAAPASYTGEDVVELTLHGSPVVAAAVVAAAVREGARAARAGEFTLRAFLNGKLDLAQAEAVEDLVSATTGAQARMAFDQLQGTLSERVGAIEERLFDLSARLEASVDFAEEGYHFVEVGEVVETLQGVEAGIAALLAGSERGRLLREGATVAIVGGPNVGKSTVFNRLAGSDRAIVTEVPGTTRDLLIESVALGGVPVTVVDTAGIRATADPVEREGVSRAAKAREAATVVLVVLDGSRALAPEDEGLLRETSSRRRVVAVNKSDLTARFDLDIVEGPVMRISALSGVGIDALADAVARELGVGQSAEPAAVSNLRHIELLERARATVRDTIHALHGQVGQMPEDVVLSELRSVREALEGITGRRTSEEMLERIFSRFCIGK